MIYSAAMYRDIHVVMHLSSHVPRFVQNALETRFIFEFIIVNENQRCETEFNFECSWFRHRILE